MTTVLVTGAAGNAGARIAAAAARNGHQVIALSRSERVPALDGLPGVQVIQADLSHPLDLAITPMAIIHAAAQARPNGVPVASYLQDNALATAHLARFAASRGGCPFIYLSSLSIYGQISAPVVNENSPRVNPCSYGMSKYFGECALAEVAADLPSLSLRLPGIVGPNSDGPWLARLVMAAIKGDDIAITNSNAMFNNVVHVDDVAAFALSAIQRTWQGAHATTIAATAPLTVRQLADLVVATAESSSIINDLGERGTPFTISSTLAEQMFGYCPRTVTDIVRQYVNEMRNALDPSSRSLGTGGRARLGQVLDLT